MSSRLTRIREAEAKRRIQRQSRGRRLGRFLLRTLRALALLSLVAGVLGAGGAWFGYRHYVLDNPGPHLDRAHILDVIAQESPVLYRDGRTRIGVFFASEHRDYVPWKRIPKAWVDAIVSSEDQRYFEHRGVDPIGIGRAMLANLQAGGVVAGGSSLTQQTAKNLYYRPDRSLRAKGVELLDALRLESRYSKQDILEFYANQFHVSANGRGLGIAARYFFDKEVEELSTLECAFLAGMVKAPAAYNPFVGSTEERRQQARARAKARTGYVLDRMLVLGKIGQAEHDRLIEQEIPFKRGTFRYDSSVLLDEVALRLEQPPFPALFAELGIDNPSTAGIQVVTTLDPSLQVDATHALWHHLSEVGPLMEGQGAAALRRPSDEAPHPDPDNPLQVHGFSTATVVAATDKELTLDLGGPRCVVDAEGLGRMATVLHRAKSQNPYAKAAKGASAELARALPVGSVVWASLRDQQRCDLELRPELQGALLVLEDGQIRAMVGGNDNRNFNRAITAKRQLGSTWKSLVYHAALSLGWAPSDLLDNREGVFVFEGTWYYPRADHESTDRVTLHQAGTRSENLASIWLLYHLLDRLEGSEFRAVAERAGMTPREGEDREAWIRRVRDDNGVISTPARFGELAFHAARQELLATGQLTEDEAVAVMSLHYGRGADAELARLSKGSAKTRAKRSLAVRTNYLALEEQRVACDAELTRLLALSTAGRAAQPPTGLFGWLKETVPAPVAPEPSSFRRLQQRPRGEGLALGCGQERSEAEPWAPIDAALLEALTAGQGPELPGAGALLLSGGVSAGTLAELGRISQRRKLVLESADPWDFDTLQYHPDFRVLVALRYVAAEARAFGVDTELAPVLSLPLGAVDISLAEAVSLYEGLLSGEATHFRGERVGGLPWMASAPEAPDRTLLIAEIRDRNGELLYRARPVAKRIAAAEAGVMLGDILRSVVEFGTGQRARGAVSLGGAPVPLAGKTGTTNSFRNAAFIGYVPRATASGWDGVGGYTVGVYVGYDDNRPMAKGATRLAGASGALPAWILAAQALADRGLLGSAPPSDGSVEWQVPGGFAAVPVDPETGFVSAGSGQRRMLVQGEGLQADGQLSVDRLLSPVLRFDLESAAQPTIPPPAAAGGPPGAAAGDPAFEADVEEVWVEDMAAGEGIEAAPGAGDEGGEINPFIEPGAADPAPDAAPEAPVEAGDGDDMPEGFEDVDVVPRILPD